MAASVCSGCHNKAPQTGWFEQRKFIFSEFCRKEVQDQDIGCVDFFRGLSLWLRDGCILTGSTHDFTPYVYIPGITSFKFPFLISTSVSLD